MSGTIVAPEHGTRVARQQHPWGEDAFGDLRGVKPKVDRHLPAGPGAGGEQWGEERWDRARSEVEDEAQEEVAEAQDHAPEHLSSSGRHDSAGVWSPEPAAHQAHPSSGTGASAGAAGGGGGASSGLTGSPASEDAEERALRLDAVDGGGEEREGSAGGGMQGPGLSHLVDCGDAQEQHPVLLYRPKSLLHLDQHLLASGPGGGQPWLPPVCPPGSGHGGTETGSPHGFHSFHEGISAGAKHEGFSEDKESMVHLGLTRQLSSTGVRDSEAFYSDQMLHPGSVPQGKPGRERGLVAALGLARRDVSKGGSASAASHSVASTGTRSGEGFRVTGAPEAGCGGGFDDHHTVSSFRSGGGLGVDSEEDRRQKRMLSNRESARRSRQRKQRKVEEMKDQASGLAAQNADMAFKCEKASKSLQQLNRENRVLRSHAMELSRRLQRLNYMASVHGHGPGHPGTPPMGGPWRSGAHDMGLGMVPPYGPPSYPPGPGFHGDPFSAGYGYMGREQGPGSSPYVMPYGSLDLPGGLGLETPAPGAAGDLDPGDDVRRPAWGPGHHLAYNGGPHPSPYWSPSLSGEHEGLSFGSKASSIALPPPRSPPALSLFPGHVDLH